MRPGVPLPLGAAMKLLASFLILQGCWEIGAEVGRRNIRRITAADLPSSNSTDATKVRLKTWQNTEGKNCTKAGSCSNPTTAASHSNPEGKRVSSFIGDDVPEGHLQMAVLSHLTTTTSQYGGGYDSYFDGDEFEDRSAHVTKTSFFSKKRHSATEPTNFDAPLTTPRISVFDDVHNRMTEALRQNLQDMGEHRFRDITLQHGDNVGEAYRTAEITVPPAPSPGDPTEKTVEELSLQFLSNFSIVYNDTESPHSMTRDIVIENGTHIDYESTHVHTKLQPEINRTTFYISNDTHSTINPANESVLTTDSKNGSHTSQINTTVETSRADALSLESSDQSSAHLNTAASMNVTQNNNTGTPDGKDSTTSEPTRDRSFSGSHEPRIYSSSQENLAVTSDMPVTLSVSNETKLSIIDIERKYANKDTLTSSSNGAILTKDPESNAVGPVSTGKYTNRASRKLVSRRGQYNSTNGLEQSSLTPLSSGSSENSFNSDDTTKKPRARYNLRRNGKNRSENETESSTAWVEVTTVKENPCNPVTEGNGMLSESAPSTRSVQNGTNWISGGGFTGELAKSSTEGYNNSSRGRAFTYRRPYTAASTETRDNEAAGNRDELSTVSTSSVNVEAVRRRPTTLKRRLQPSTEVSVTLVPSSSSTTENNAIVRGFPAIARRKSVVKNTPSNKTADETDNDERNDIITVNNNVHKSVTRNRGSVRYGSQQNDTSGALLNATSVFPIPPTAAAWTLVTVEKPGNETRNWREDNSTSDAQIRRWTPTRGRRPWGSEERESTTTASDAGNTESALTSPKSTKLRQMIRVRGALSHKRIQQSSMQENRLSTVQVAAPTSEQVGETTEQTTSVADDEVPTASPSPQVTTETKDLTTTSGIWYRQTEALISVTSTTTETSTNSDMERGDMSYSSYLVPESQVTIAMTPVTVDDIVTGSTESVDSSTTKFESTTVQAEIATTEGSLLGRSSIRDISLSTFAADEDAVTSNIESLFLQTRENDQQHEGKSGNNLGTPYAKEEKDAGDTGDTIEQGGSSTTGKVLEDDVNQPENGSKTRAEGNSSEYSYTEGDISGRNSEEIKISGGSLQMDDNMTSEGPSVIPSGGDESPDYGDGPESAVLDHTFGVISAETTSTSSPLRGSDDEIMTPDTAEVEHFATLRREQTTTWSSNTVATEGDVDSTMFPSEYDVPLYLVLSINVSWSEFCEHLDKFKQSVVNFMRSNGRSIETYQVILRNVDPTSCTGASTSLTEVEMYLVNESNHFDHQLTSDFYTFWTESKSGLTDFPFYINTVQPAAQTSVGSSDEGGGGGGGMIAAITISCIGALCLLLLAVLWLVMRKRQQRFNYGQRCTPVSLDAYSLDSVSVCGSVRRKGGVRNSKRSYGNAGFDDPSSPSHPMGFAGLANFILNREALEEEFAGIPQVTANVDDLPEGADAKNRYANVIPLPETRVQLSLREGEPLSDYINANFVHGPKNASKYYIACQAPLASTVTDFWRMIWEQQSKVILMLTDLVENGVEKCADYLPPSEVLDCHRLFGDFQITLKKREVKEQYIISTLQLKNLETNLWREVMHLWYVNWPIQGVPDDVSSVIAFLLEARPYMRGGPCVVHCSPGTGRTGTVIASDLCIRDFETTRIVDIPRCVAQLRRDRAGAVQTRDQYAFIYHVINLYGTKLTGGALDSM